MLIGDILYRFKGDYSNLDSGAAKSSKTLEKTGLASDSLKGRFTDLQNTTSQLGGVFATIFATVMAGGLAAFMKSVALTAARTQVLGTTLLVVGENAGYTRKELIEQEKSLKKLGITTQVARNTLVRMIQTQMDVTKAEGLANAARNLAVVSGKNTSATLQTLILGLVTLQTETLRTAGITINLETESKKWAAANKVVYSTMTMMQRRQAALNAIIEQALALDGAYITAQEDLGKQLASFARYTEEASNMFGEFYLPSLLRIVLATRDLLKGYQALDPETRRLISTVAVFATGLGVLAAAFIGVLTLGPLLLSLFGLIAAAFTPVIAVIAVVGVAITAFGALWSTNMWGVRDVTTEVWALIKATFMAGITTVNNAMGSLMLSLKLLRDVMSKPWEAGALFYEFQEGLNRLTSDVVDRWKDVGAAASATYDKIGRSADASNIELKEGSLKLTEEQIRQREVLRDYGVIINRELITELKNLHGEELANFVAMRKKKLDIERSLMAQALAIEARYVKGLYDLHVKELKQKVDLERAKLELMKEFGEISEQAAIEASYQLSEKLFKAEIAFREKNLKESLVIMKKQQKPMEDIELARLKGFQEIESLKFELVKARLKKELALYETSVSDQADLDERLLESLRHRHQMEELEDQKAVDVFLMSHSEMLDKKGQRDLEAQNVYILTLKARLTSLKAAGRAEGDEYRSLNDEYVGALNERERIYRDHQNRLLQVTIQEEEKRLDILFKLRSERHLSQFKSDMARRAYELHYATQQEIKEMEKRVKESKVPYEEFYAWKRAKEQETADDLKTILMEAQKGTEEYIEHRIKLMTEAGATEKEITAEVFALKREYATTFVEGWKLGLEEMVADTYTWADVSTSIVQGFAQNAANVLDDTLFDFFKTGTFDLMGMFESLGNAMLRIVTQALAQMAVQWFVNLASSTAYSSVTMAGLAAEQASVTALIAQYYALAMAKAAAGVAGGAAGMQHGAVIPGYGGGDRIPVLVEGGERIIAKEEARKYFPLLESIAAGTFPLLQGYQQGGVVEDRSVVISQPIGKEAADINIFNVTDPNEVLRILASRSGEEAVLNIIGRRTHTTRRLLQ